MTRRLILYGILQNRTENRWAVARGSRQRFTTRECLGLLRFFCILFVVVVTRFRHVLKLKYRSCFDKECILEDGRAKCCLILTVPHQLFKKNIVLSSTLHPSVILFYFLGVSFMDLKKVQTNHLFLFTVNLTHYIILLTHIWIFTGIWIYFCIFLFLYIPFLPSSCLLLH